MNRRGFTLIELLVVIAIIAILAAILFPVFLSAKERAQQTKCASNMKQLGTAIISYADDWNGITPYGWHLPSDPQFPNYMVPWAKGTWRDHVKPYVKSKGIFLCPAKTRYIVDNNGSPHPNVYSGLPVSKVDVGHYGINSIIICHERQSRSKPMGFVNISSEIRLPSKTILVAENYDSDWAVEPYVNASSFGAEGQFWPYHGLKENLGGVFIFCDGHAKFMRETEASKDNYYMWYAEK
ncbi:MAG TPA: prepilin-type N-terminal cleavage/methylation domain-containing protein [Armatimonadota bacterium]|nr:prepilin-type N-terminal cleavage/methylation domain-containing protein [Armatimonadota bacterium]